MAIQMQVGDLAGLPSPFLIVPRMQTRILPLFFFLMLFFSLLKLALLLWYNFFFFFYLITDLSLKRLLHRSLLFIAAARAAALQWFPPATSPNKSTKGVTSNAMRPISTGRAAAAGPSWDE